MIIMHELRLQQHNSFIWLKLGSVIHTASVENEYQNIRISHSGLYLADKKQSSSTNFSDVFSLAS